MRARATAAILGLFAFGASLRANAQPAFPGAQGFGAAATGGRGGQVIKVTTLSPTGPGSLQEALDTPGPRIVVFAVSGVIEGDILIPHGDVTIAGQTAPGGGITIQGRLTGEYDYAVQNIVIRHVRVRPIYDGSPGEQFDSIQLSRNSLVILDHVSVSWGVDETIDLYEANDVTVQWSTIEESATMGHPEGQHNYGLIQGPDGFRISLHHNLFVHNQNRNPAIANGPAEVRNNLVYDVRHGFVHHNPASGPFNIVGNVYVQGPEDDLIPFFFDDENGFTAPDLGYFLADNAIDDPGDFVGVVDNPWAMPFQHPSFENLTAPESLRSDTEFSFDGVGYVPVATDSSAEARTLVVAHAGACPRDVVTTRVFDELAALGGSWGAKVPADLMEGLSPTTPPEDADDDGMADAWETDHGLDPANGSDHSTVMPSGYTAIEDYLAELAGATGCAAPTTGSGGGSSSSGAGPSGSGGAGGGSASNGAGASGAAGSGAEPSISDSGCDCGHAGAAPRGAVGWWLAAAIGLSLARRRHNRARSMWLRPDDRGDTRSSLNLRTSVIAPGD